MDVKVLDVNRSPATQHSLKFGSLVFFVPLEEERRCRRLYDSSVLPPFAYESRW